MFLSPHNRDIAPGVQDRRRKRQKTSREEAVLRLQRHKQVEKNKDRDRRQDTPDPERRKTDRNIRVDLAALPVDSRVGNPVSLAKRHKPDGKQRYVTGFFLNRKMVGQRTPIRIICELCR